MTPAARNSVSDSLQKDSVESLRPKVESAGREAAPSPRDASTRDASTRDTSTVATSDDCNPRVTREERPARSWFSPLLWTLCALIGYVLSPLPIGVALDLLPPRVAARLHGPIRGVYRPIIWLSDRSPPVRAFYDWYENLLEV